MTDHLRFVLTHKAHPHPEDQLSAAEAWGEFSVLADDDLLLRTEWNLEAFIEWFLETRNQRFSTSLPDVLPGESLAKAFRRLQQALNDETDDTQADWLSETQWNFWSEHSLRYGFRGSRIPDIIIGINQGAGDLSYCTWDVQLEDDFRERSWLKSGSWEYRFNAADFENATEQHLRDFLKQWLERTDNPFAIAKAHRLFAQF